MSLSLSFQNLKRTQTGQTAQPRKEVKLSLQVYYDFVSIIKKNKENLKLLFSLYFIFLNLYLSLSKGILNSSYSVHGS